MSETQEKVKREYKVAYFDAFAYSDRAGQDALVFVGASGEEYSVTVQEVCAALTAAPALLEALKVAVKATAGHVRWCNYCGQPDDANEKSTPHTNTCWVPAAEAAIVLAEGVAP